MKERRIKFDLDKRIIQHNQIKSYIIEIEKI